MLRDRSHRGLEAALPRNAHHGHVPVIEAILPTEAVAEEAFSDLPGVTLFPEAEVARALGSGEPERARFQFTGQSALPLTNLPTWLWTASPWP